MLKGTITGHRTGGEWSITMNEDGTTHTYSGGTLLAILEDIVREQKDAVMGIARDDEPDLHDLTGESRHRGLRIPHSWRSYK